MEWKERIANAVERGEFTKDDKVLAFNWRTCVVGEHKGQFMNMSFGYEKPTDQFLYDLGLQFGEAVRRSQVARAEAIYHDIQDWFS